MMQMHAADEGPRAVKARPFEHATSDAHWYIHRTFQDGREPIGSVLLLHGAGSSGHSFTALSATLARRGYRTFAPDLLGHARTRAAPDVELSIPSQGAALRRLLDEVSVQPDIVVAHSAGAAVACQLILRHELRPKLLVGLAPALTPLPSLARRWMPLVSGWMGRSSVLPHVIAYQAAATDSVAWVLRRTGSPLTDSGRDAYERLASRPSHVAGVLQMLGQWDLRPIYASMEKVDELVDTLFIGGLADRAIPIGQLRRLKPRMPRSSIRELSGLGHLLHEEAPECVASLICEGFEK